MSAAILPSIFYWYLPNEKITYNLLKIPKNLYQSSPFLLTNTNHAGEKLHTLGTTIFIRLIQPEAENKLCKKIELIKETSLHIRIHSLEFVPSNMSALGDLRQAPKCVKEIIASFIQDQDQSDIICFQELCNEDATKMLTEAISKIYRHMIHSIAANIVGFCNRSVIVSNYSIEHVFDSEKVTQK